MQVVIGKPSHRGRLFPRYDDESEILAVESPISREWPFGIDVDGRVVFDIDADRMLANIDLHVPRRLWVERRIPPWPVGAVTGSLYFTAEAIKLKSFNLPLEVSIDSTQPCMHLSFGDGHSQVVELSESCAVLLSDDGTLAGFLIRGF